VVTGAVILFLFIAIYALVAVWLGKRSITMPIFFIIVGAITGPYGLKLFNLSLSSENVKILVEVTLALLLFADSSTLKLHHLKEDAGLPSRLLGIALPLIIVLGGLLAYGFFPAEGLGFALLVGAILAPTDAALGLPIFTNPRVPVRIRRALNVESGLNDGIATPFVTLFTAWAVAEETQKLTGWAYSALVDISIAICVGVVFGMIGGWLFSYAMRRRLTSRATEQIGTLALTLLIYFSSIMLGGNGFIAAFVGGLFFSYSTRHHKHHTLEFTEATGTTLSLFVWTLFGAFLVIPLITSFNILALVYALLSLTLIRMVPVTISLIRTNFRSDTRLLMGWLGPRGLASVVFTLIAYEAFQENSLPHQTLFAIASWTILLSVLLHGFSARPLASWYADRLKKAPASSPELIDVPVLHPVQDRFSKTHQNSTQFADAVNYEKELD
jgi:NhaP-type Na+/H+ or K+/H+ antiporter